MDTRAMFVVNQAVQLMVGSDPYKGQLLEDVVQTLLITLGRLEDYLHAGGECPGCPKCESDDGEGGPPAGSGTMQ
jgi:hypothetical protein